MTTNTVFMKKKLPDYKLDYKSIISTIPVNSYSEPQLDKSDKIEIRWRFLNIPLNSNNGQNIRFKNVVEISRKKPNGNREYINKNMKWIETTVDSSYDEFVSKQYYYYTDE